MKSSRNFVRLAVIAGFVVLTLGLSESIQQQRAFGDVTCKTAKCTHGRCIALFDANDQKLTCRHYDLITCRLGSNDYCVDDFGTCYPTEATCEQTKNKVNLSLDCSCETACKKIGADHWEWAANCSDCDDPVETVHFDCKDASPH